MIKLIIAGDFCPMSIVKEQIENKNFDKIFGALDSIFSKSDYSVVNLEAPILTQYANPISKMGIHVSSPLQTAEALKYVGFNLVTLANNHINDFGDIGVKNTIEVCRDNNIDIVGGGINIYEAQKPIICDIKKKKIAFINFCENEFSVATEKCGGANPLNPIKNYYQIQNAKKDSDFVVVITHGGVEHYQYPTPRMKEAYRFFVDAGADAVVNHHQHCYSGFEYYKNKPIVYGIGNFLFDSPFKEKNTFFEGYLVEIIFEDNNIPKIKLHPFNQCKGDDHSIKLMSQNEEEIFNNKISQINAIIKDDFKLKKEYLELLDVCGASYVNRLEPYKTRIARFLLSRNIIPSYLSKKKLVDFYGLINCESHRDILLQKLKEKYDAK